MEENIKYYPYSIAQIKKDYHLDVLCPARTAQKENIALSIKLLYFFCDMLKSTFTNDIEILMCREIIILSYSILDGIVGCLGFKMQEQCNKCNRRCSYYFNEMSSSDTEFENEEKSFKRAKKHLEDCKILYWSKGAKDFHSMYRNYRNNIHLTKNAKVINNDPFYTRESSNKAVEFLQEFIDVLYHNYQEFVENNRCYNQINKTQRRK